jgi:hypothetical protein
MERMTEELQRLQAENEELEFQMQDMQHTLDAKKQVEYYSNIIGMALPGLAKFLTNSPMGAAMTKHQFLDWLFVVNVEASCLE